METDPLSTHLLFSVGPVKISEAVVTTWVILLLLGLGSAFATRRFTVHPGTFQSFIEIFVTTIEKQIEDITKRPAKQFLPLIGTLFVFLVVANLSAQVPGVSAPTERLETAGALALIVFIANHAYGIKYRGLKGYLERYLEPNPIMLPLNILADITRTFSLMVRLFGNIMSHALVIAIVVSLAGLFVPIPIMLLGIIIGLVQAYIFTVLATVFLGAAIGPATTPENSNHER